MANKKVLSFKDSMILSELTKQDNHVGLQGIVVVSDEDGNVLFTKKNLIVRNGREFALRKIFDIPNVANSENKATLDQRSVFLFGIGSGGTPAGDPFNPLAPSPADSDLTYKLPFRITTPSTPLTNTEMSIYTNSVDQANGTTYWLKKHFTQDPTLVVNAVDNEVYVEMILDISSADARDFHINELALYQARDEGNNMSSGYDIFSRITFETEPMPSSSNKSLSIKYYVYC